MNRSCMSLHDRTTHGDCPSLLDLSGTRLSRRIYPMIIQVEAIHKALDVMLVPGSTWQAKNYVTPRLQMR